MNRRTREKGEGRIALFVAIAIVGATAFVGLKVIPARVAAYEFKDILREEARYGAVRDSDKAVHKRIMDRAAALEIPLSKKNLKVSRTVKEIIIIAKYEQSIDLKLTTYVFKFEHKEKAPLF